MRREVLESNSFGDFLNYTFLDTPKVVVAF